MATASAKGPKKTDFVRRFVKKNRTANRKAVEEAWRDAGNEGPISSGLVSNLRRELGLTGNKRGGSEPTVGNGAAESPKATARASKLGTSASKQNGKAPFQNNGTQAPPTTKREPQSGNRDGVLAEIEADIDRLIFKLMSMGGMDDIEEGLRGVRRLLYRRYRT
jgi:hypothetical protein